MIKWKKKDSCTSLKEVIERNTGMSEADFLRDDYQTPIKNMDEMIAELNEIAADGRSVGVFADYDCDGICSAVIMHIILQLLKVKSFKVYFPKRSTGYGLKPFNVDNIDKDVVASMPVIDLQKYDYLNKGDLKGLRKLLAYYRDAYDKAPVEEREGRLYADLPEEIFKIKSRDVTDELSLLRRKDWVDAVRCSKAGFDIDAHIYLPRFNVEKPEDQVITIHLINEETGQILDIETRPIEAKHITDLRGKVEDPVSGSVANYNYDYSGFTFRIEPALFEDSAKRGIRKYSVVLEYQDRIFSGNQIMRGISRDVKAECKRMHVRKGLRKISINFGYLNELQIVVTN